ncbi:hypothetical protein V8E53_007698 [Lactarius tabidus]
MTSLKYMTKKGETSAKKGGERRRTRGPALRGAQSTGLGKRAELYSNKLKIFPGGWVLVREDKGKTGVHRCVRESCVVWGGDGKEDIDSKRGPVSAVGRANAGKTSILQRVCETTESPFIYRETDDGREEVNLEPSMERGEHSIYDELVFSNHLGYVFHDSRGIESGSTKELRILQEFIRLKCKEKQLRRRLHAIWYCVPMDNQRPELDLKFYKDICLDENVFTKYDQFLRNVEMQVLDYPDEYPDGNVTEAAGKLFREHYLNPLGYDVKYVQLQKMHKQRGHCGDLLEKTATALDKDTVALMLLAVQRGNLELNVKVALNKVYFNVKDAKGIVQECLRSFPNLWVLAHAGGAFQIKQDHDLDPHIDVWLVGQDSDEYYTAEEDEDDKPFMMPIFGSLESLTPGSSAYFKSIGIFIWNLQKLHPLTDLSHHYLMLAVLIILKHATFLLLSNLSSKSALTQAEKDYQAGNIGSEIQQFLSASPQNPSKEQFASFIKANDIVPSQKKDHWLKQIWKPILLHKSTKQHKGGSVAQISSGSGVASSSGM